MSEAVASELLTPRLANRACEGPGTPVTGPTLLRSIATNIFTIGVGGLGALFTLLIARLLGQAALGGFLVAWRWPIC